jgi:hypothetical protein
MILTTSQPMRRCGRRWAAKGEAEHSKAFLAGGQLAVPCGYGCGGFHLEEIKSAPRESRGAAKAGKPAPRDTGPDRRTRAAVYARDGFACVCCGTPIEGRPHSVGHRKRRSQGGGNQMSNLLTFLGLGSNPLDPGDHHARIDSRQREYDETAGYTVRSFRDPALIGVRYTEQSGSWILMYLGDDGSISPDAPVGAVA